MIDHDSATPMQMFAIAVKAIELTTGKRAVSVPCDAVFYRMLRLELIRTVEGAPSDLGADGFFTLGGIDVFDQSRMFSLAFGPGEETA